MHTMSLPKSNLITEDDMKSLAYESLSCAILDSGTTATVAGSMWMECYLDSLSHKERSKVAYSQSNNSFSFVFSKVFKSLHKVRISALIGSKSVSIIVDIIEYDIPLMFLIDSMKKANTQINYMDASVAMFGTKLDVKVTQSMS